MSFPRSIAANQVKSARIANTTKTIGDGAEDAALRYLLSQGLTLVARNFKTPGRGGGEIDLIMRDAGTLVFIEVRRRKTASHGGAAGSVSGLKQGRIVFAAQHFLSRLPRTPPCRFDVVAIEGEASGLRPIWLKAAFDAS
ncbi:MAG: YraN family protein [Brachymonas sp.]|nr:YraN family protein [Brachymonas sp.]